MPGLILRGVLHRSIVARMYQFEASRAGSWRHVNCSDRGGEDSMNSSTDDADERDSKSEARSHGVDEPLAIWDAMCRLEQRLRERTAPRSFEDSTAN
jgi:hypothetical protein